MFDLSHFDFDLNRDSDLIDYLLNQSGLFPSEEEHHSIFITCDENLGR